MEDSAGGGGPPAAGGGGGGGGGLDFSETFSDANPGSAAAQLGGALPPDATELRLVPSPVPSAEPGMHAAAAADADARLPIHCVDVSADVMAAIGAVKKIHAADMSPAAAFPIARLEQKPQYSRSSSDCQYLHLQASPDGERNINGDVLVKIRGNGGDGLNGISVTLCQVVRGPGGSLNVTEPCHLDVPVALLWAVNNFKLWKHAAKGVAIPGFPDTHIVLSESDSASGYGAAGDTLPFVHSMQLEYEACIAENFMPALDNARKLVSSAKRVLMHAGAISSFRAALKEQSFQYVLPQPIADWCQSTSVAVLTPAVINLILATPCVLGRVVTALKLLPGIPLLNVCATVKHTIEMAVLFRMLPPPPRTAAIATEGYGSNLALGTPPTRDMLLSPASLSKIYPLFAWRRIFFPFPDELRLSGMTCSGSPKSAVVTTTFSKSAV